VQHPLGLQVIGMAADENIRVEHRIGFIDGQLHIGNVGAAGTATQMGLNDFLAWEAEQPYKHEYWKGEVFAMTGARQAHVLVAGNCFAALKAHLRIC
jgi:hypothetical protein